MTLKAMLSTVQMNYVLTDVCRETAARGERRGGGVCTLEKYKMRKTEESVCKWRSRWKEVFNRKIHAGWNKEHPSLLPS